MDFKKILFKLYLNSITLHSPKKYDNRIFASSIKQKGGKGNKLSIEYKEHKYKFIESEIDDNYYILYTLDDKFSCVSVIINKEAREAEIHEIGNDKTCVNLSNVKVGSILLKITIKMLKKYKDKFNINKIILTDNSIKSCSNINIILSKMLILLTGDTWYGRYGFRPNSKNKFYINGNELYENNKKIMDKITIKEANIIKYIKMTNKEKLIKATDKLLSINPDFLLKDFLTNLLKEYDKTCTYFYIFYERLFTDIGLTDFRGITFSLSI